MTPKQIGAKFRLLRHSLELSQKEIAHWLGCAPSSIPNYESGRSEIPFSIIRQFIAQNINLRFFIRQETGVDFADLKALKKTIRDSINN